MNNLTGPLGLPRWIMNRLMFGAVQPLYWVGIALAGAGLVEGISSQNKAQGAMDSSGQLAQDQANDSVRDKRLSGQLFDDYGSYGLPAMEKYLSAAETPIDQQKAANQAVGAIDEQEPAAKAAMQRSDASYGLNPNSGRAQSERSTFNLNTAIDKAGAATAARRQAVQQTLQNLQGAASAGNSLLSGSESFAGMTPSGFNGAASTEGNIANQEGQMAAGGGQLLGYGLSGYMNSNNYQYTGASSTPTVNNGNAGYTPTPIYQPSG